MTSKITLVLFVSCICVSSKSQKQAPDRLGDFIVGKTIFQDFWIKIEAYGLIASTSLEISSQDELSAQSVMPDEQDNYNSLVYEIEDNADDTMAAWLTWVPVSDSMRVLFVPQMKIENLTINNATFRFFNDTLFSLSYDCSFDVLDLLTANYKGKGELVYNKSKVSPCKILHKGKRFTNNSKQFQFIDEENNIFSIISTETGLNANCRAFGYIRVNAYQLAATTRYVSILKQYSRSKKESVILRAKEAKKRKLNSF